MTPKIIDKETKRREIYTAALPVFAAKGLDKTKMEDIAKAAGIGKGTVYEYFSNKEEILAVAFNDLFAETEMKIRQVVMSNSGPEKKMCDIIELFFSIFEDDYQTAAILMDFWAEGIRNKDVNITSVIDLKEIYKGYREIFSLILQEGINAGIFAENDKEKTASIIIGALDGIMLQWIIEPEIFTPGEIKEVMVKIILNGIKK